MNYEFPKLQLSALAMRPAAGASAKERQALTPGGTDACGDDDHGMMLSV